ncbi:MAG: hypothetical protein DHS20C13_04580 [Thermodesulfobacteriota bacterium]|nr:MAG: hypothetical protein DHS20C13_04580 [Thermodesulfobacteriota bacterium]
MLGYSPRDQPKEENLLKYLLYEKISQSSENSNGKTANQVSVYEAEGTWNREYEQILRSAFI